MQVIIFRDVVEFMLFVCYGTYMCNAPNVLISPLVGDRKEQLWKLRRKSLV